MLSSTINTETGNDHISIVLLSNVLMGLIHTDCAIILQQQDMDLPFGMGEELPFTAKRKGVFFGIILPAYIHFYEKRCFKINWLLIALSNDSKKLPILDETARKLGFFLILINTEIATVCSFMCLSLHQAFKITREFQIA